MPSKIYNTFQAKHGIQHLNNFQTRVLDIQYVNMFQTCLTHFHNNFKHVSNQHRARVNNSAETRLDNIQNSSNDKFQVIYR